MANIARGSMKSEIGPQLWDLNNGTGWWAVSVNGVVTYTGPEKQCRKRYAILMRLENGRELQDHALGRLFL